MMNPSSKFVSLRTQLKLATSFKLDHDHTIFLQPNRNVPSRYFHPRCQVTLHIHINRHLVGFIDKIQCNYWTDWAQLASFLVKCLILTHVYAILHFDHSGEIYAQLLVIDLHTSSVADNLPENENRNYQQQHKRRQTSPNRFTGDVSLVDCCGRCKSGV
jgi:hypothetical protein